MKMYIYINIYNHVLINYNIKVSTHCNEQIKLRKQINCGYETLYVDDKIFYII